MSQRHRTMLGDRHRTVSTRPHTGPVNIRPLWFADAPPPDRGDSVDERHWRRRQTTGAGLWVLDQRLSSPPAEPIEHMMGMTPTLVLDLLVESGISLPYWLLELGPTRDRATGEVTALAEICLITADGSPVLGIWWKRDDFTLFATWWDGWLTGGLRPTDGDHAVRLEELFG